MLYYLLFRAILGFIFHFYIIFGTNLLTGGPAQICCFMPISVFWRKGISDGVKMEWNQLEKLFLEGNTPDGLGPHVKEGTRCSRGWGAPPLGRAPLSRGALVAPLTYLLHPYIPTWPKTSKTKNRLGVTLPEASVATENQSRPVPTPCRRGKSLSGGHLHHPGALHDEDGVVLPWGWGYVPVAMCLISLSLSLSLSLSCSWFGMILMYHNLC